MCFKVLRTHSVGALSCFWASSQRPNAKLVLLLHYRLRVSSKGLYLYHEHREEQP